MSPCKLCLLEVPEMAHLAAKRDWGICSKHAEVLIKENRELKEQLSGVVASELVNGFIGIFKR